MARLRMLAQSLEPEQKLDFSRLTASAPVAPPAADRPVPAAGPASRPADAARPGPDTASRPEVPAPIVPARDGRIVAPPTERLAGREVPATRSRLPSMIALASVGLLVAASVVAGPSFVKPLWSGTASTPARAEAPAGRPAPAPAMAETPAAAPPGVAPPVSAAPTVTAPSVTSAEPVYPREVETTRLAALAPSPSRAESAIDLPPVALPAPIEIGPVAVEAPVPTYAAAIGAAVPEMPPAPAPVMADPVVVAVPVVEPPATVIVADVSVLLPPIVPVPDPQDGLAAAALAPAPVPAVARPILEAAAAPAVPVAAPVAVTPVQQAADDVASLTEPSTVALVARAQTILALGDVSGARLLLKRAADLGDPIAKAKLAQPPFATRPAPRTGRP